LHNIINQNRAKLLHYSIDIIFQLYFFNIFSGLPVIVFDLLCWCPFLLFNTSGTIFIRNQYGSLNVFVIFTV